MPKYAKAGTAIVGVPKNMLFMDASNHPHLLNTTTKTHKIATHYGTPAVLVANNGTKRRVKTVVKAQTADYKKQMKEMKKSISDVKSTGEAMVKKAKAQKKLTEKLSAVVASNDMINGVFGSVLSSVPAKRGRGRPKGSKNKKKV